MKTKQNFLLLGALALAVMSQTQPATAADSNVTTKADSKPAAKADTLFDDPIIARGTGVEIKRSQLDEAFINAKAAAAASGVSFSEPERKLLEVRLLNELIVSKLLTRKATDADRARAREVAEKFIAQSRKQFPTEEAFNARLKLNKMTLEELRTKLVTEAIPNAVLERGLKATLTVTDDQVKKFYADNPAKFEAPETVRVAHILIGTRDMATSQDLPADVKQAKRKQIDDLLKRVKAGEDFTKLAKQYSEDPGSKDTGGEYTFARGQMVPEFETAAFMLKKGEISPVVTSTYGYHIIKQLDKTPARVVPLSETSANIKDYLTQQEAAKLAPAYFEKLKKDGNVEILDEELKAADKTAMAAAAAGATK